MPSGTAGPTSRVANNRDPLESGQRRDVRSLSATTTDKNETLKKFCSLPSIAGPRDNTHNAATLQHFTGLSRGGSSNLLRPTGAQRDSSNVQEDPAPPPPLGRRASVNRSSRDVHLDRKTDRLGIGNP